VFSTRSQSAVMPTTRQTGLPSSGGQSTRNTVAYAGFLIREVLLSDPRRAVGVGIFPKVLYNPSFWATAIVLSLVLFFWKLRYHSSPGSWY